jgi:hypothetical protein
MLVDVPANGQNMLETNNTAVARERANALKIMVFALKKLLLPQSRQGFDCCNLPKVPEINKKLKLFELQMATNVFA